MGGDLPDGAVPLGADNHYLPVLCGDTWIGVYEYHLNAAGRRCAGWVAFDRRGEAGASPLPVWTVECLEPLTLSPSLLCTACGSRGYIQGGRWVAC